MTRVVWSAPAVADLDAIHEYISRDSVVYADGVILEMLTAVERLEQFPQSGRLVREYDDGKTREIIVGNYRIIYEATSDVVEILAVIHGARLLKP